MKTRTLDDIAKLDIELSKAFNLAIKSVDNFEETLEKSEDELKELFQSIYDIAFNAYSEVNEELPDFYDDYLWNLDDTVTTKDEYSTEEYQDWLQYYLSEFAEEISWDIEGITIYVS